MSANNSVSDMIWILPPAVFSCWALLYLLPADSPTTSTFRDFDTLLITFPPLSLMMASMAERGWLRVPVMTKVLPVSCWLLGLLGGVGSMPDSMSAFTMCW